MTPKTNMSESILQAQLQEIIDDNKEEFAILEKNILLGFPVIYRHHKDKIKVDRFQADSDCKSCKQEKP